jgi:signal transduction histidine kinase/ActR/RegA family two-component response regulator
VSFVADLAARARQAENHAVSARAWPFWIGMPAAPSPSTNALRALTKGFGPRLFRRLRCLAFGGQDSLAERQDQTRTAGRRPREGGGREDDGLTRLDNPGKRRQQQLADGRWVLIEERRARDGGVIGLRVDITDLKRQTADLEAALERARADNRAQSAFLAHMSQKVRTPLNSVLGLSDVLGRGPLDPSQREVLVDLAAAAARMNAVLGALMDFSRLEAGQVAFQPAPFALAELLDEVVASHEPAARKKGLALEIRARLAVGAQVIGDAVRLKQVLDHLIDNAIKFTAHGFVELSVTPGEGAHDYRFEVRDSGVGFEPEDAERLFLPFAPADGALGQSHDGGGLGLAICQRLTQLMGGQIVAAGHPGRGAVFTVTLPLEAVLASAPPLSEAGFVHGGVPRVLAADDNEVNRKLVELILRSISADVVSVENGLEAVRAMERERFDLVLMDLQMPVMDGLTAIRRIRAWEAGGQHRRTPIIVLSANVMPEHRRASAAAGADAHLGKPVTVETLIAAVRGAVEDGAAGIANVA